MVVGSLDGYWRQVPENIVPRDWYIKLEKTFNAGTADEYTQKLVVEESVYNILENKQEAYKRAGTFYYTQGEKNIKGLNYKAISGSYFDPAKQAWRIVFNEYIPDFVANQAVNGIIDRHIIPSKKAAAYTAALNWYQSIYGASSGQVRFLMGFEPGMVVPFNYLLSSPTTPIHKLRFRITYIPYTETKLYTYRERKTNMLERQTTQNYNAQANVISSEILGELHDKVSKSNSGSQKQLTLLHKDRSEMLKIGASGGDYIITASSIYVNMHGISAQYELDKFYEKLNNYVSVLEKWRQFSIPKRKYS